MAMCCQCAFWVPQWSNQRNATDKGECRRHAPMLPLVVRTAPGYEPEGQFPWVFGREFCGDFKPEGQ